MTNENTTYEILDGVRRAKAAQICGKEFISAHMNGLGPEAEVPIGNLRSPKDEIPTTGVRGQDWWKILRATQNGAPMPPIEITAGSRGIPLNDVTVEEDEIDALRNSLE